MKVERIDQNKKRYLDLLLMADESELMIDQYLERGTMFALFDGDLKTIAVVTREDEKVYEIKNIATFKKDQGKGYGSVMLQHIFGIYACRGARILVGTGDCPSTLRFYEKNGFIPSHRVANFFVDHYDHPMYEEGIQLVDMVYLKKEF